jgi:phosphatidate cytidylyltransferase
MPIDRGEYMIWQRLGFGALMIALVIGVVALDGWLSAKAMAPAAEGTEMIAARTRPMCGLAITLLLAVVVMLSAFEMGRLCRAGGYSPAANWAAFVAVLLMIAPWAEMQQRLPVADRFSAATGPGTPLSLFLVTGGLLGAALVVLARKVIERAIANIAVTLLIILYLGLLGSFVVRVRCLWPGPAGAAAVSFFLITVKSGDIGAFFVGKLLGRHKLAPWVSPGKTIEGAIGAILLAVATACGGVLIWQRLESTLGPPPIQMSQAIIFAVVMALCGLLGDLIESLMKRDVGSKDSGHIVPSFGGYLDIVDSPLFTAPIAWWMLTFWARIG